MSNQSTSSSGIGVIGALGIVFVTLKLLGHVEWPWVWVLAPFWAGFAIVAVLFAVYLAVAIKQNRGRRK